MNNAWVAGQEDLKGRLAPGFLADLAVLGQDPFEIQAEELKDVQVLWTVVGGEVVYGPAGASAPGSGT